MPKRFHDTEQPEKDFYMLMPGRYKILLNWIEKKHDTAGIWDINLVQFIRDFQDLFTIDMIDLDEFIDHCNYGGKIRMMKIDGGKKLFLTTTIAFQYGAKDKNYTVLNDNSPVKRGILNRLNKHPETKEWLNEQIRKGKIKLQDDERSNKSVRAELPERSGDRFFKADDNTCQYCGEKDRPLQLDHIVPISKGGDNYNDNLITSCQGCNIKKSDRNVIEFMKSEELHGTEKLRSKIRKLHKRGLISLTLPNPTGIGNGIGKGKETIKSSSSSNLKEKNKNKKESNPPGTPRHYTYRQVLKLINDNPGTTTEDFEITGKTGSNGKKLWRRKPRPP